MDHSKKSYKWLISLAWAFEITAALVGLSVAWSLGIQAFEYQKKTLGNILGNMAYIEVILASLPFVMVALGELLKIPISQIIYEAKKIKIKIIYFIVLIAITAITFETVYLGMERQYNLITSMVTIPKQKVESNRETIKNLNSKLEKIKENTPQKIREEYQQKVEDAKKNFNTLLNNLEEEFKNKQSLDVTVEDMLLKELENDRNKIKKERDDKLSDIDSQISAQENNKLKILEQLKDAKTSFFTKSPADDLRDQIDIINKKLKELNEKRTSTQSLFAAKISNNSAEINKTREAKNRKKFEKQSTDSYQKKRSDLVKERDRVLRDLEKERQELGKEIAQEKNNIKNIQNNISIFEETIAELNNEIDFAAKNSQIYRIAMMFYAGSQRPSDISKEQADRVALIWYGSVAFIISTLGAALAFGYFILSDQKIYNNPNKLPPSRTLNRSMRLALRALRKRWKEPKVVKVTNTIEKAVPKEVIKEVPVEKVVIKEVEKEVPVDKVSLKEVPVEVVSKEIIYTPLWTNDPDRLKFGKTKVENITAEKEDEEDK
tara:strand:- start:330 stop:1973 length:1644 start_codon:yes stop_codon:yes gene_type:complete